MITTPGFSGLFGKPKYSYEEYLKGVPSDLVISLAIAFNNELNVPLDESANQVRLFRLVIERFSADQKKLIQTSLDQYNSRIIGPNKNYLFGRRYLLSMVLKEMNNYRDLPPVEGTPQQEFNFFMAYLLVVDEVHAADQIILDAALSKSSEPLGPYRMFWTTNINQYELNEDVDLGFQFLKLWCLASYSLQSLKPYAKEYLNGLGFKSFGQLFSSIYQVSKTTIEYHAEKPFGKLHYINPTEGVDLRHLKAQSIKDHIGKRSLTIRDIKKFPLYLNNKGQYLVIDEDFYRKKSFRGPFFELYYTTSLRKQKKFPDYCSDIAKKVIEEKWFQSICSQLRKGKFDTLHFDDKTDAVPDCYHRRNKVVCLTEFKAYLFPDELTANPDFEKIKEYIDLRFIRNEEGSPKGIIQLANQLKQLSTDGFEFDKDIHGKLDGKKITIYPIVCHDEFYFSMPGINEYLNTLFQNELDSNINARFDIQPLTLIDLQVLYDLMMRTGTFVELTTFVDRYHKIIDNRKKRFKENPESDTYLRSVSSFDEIYNSLFLQELKGTQRSKAERDVLFSLIGIEQEDLNLEL